ncbi:MAG TPA: ABC transporter permease [Bacteroidales bacterium]|nr:ABC transporter permease [Bacteroidales bacterium]HRS18328.1 ABC transporter permease [Bacteroidales bacterium]
MSLYNFFYYIGRYFMLMRRVVTKPDDSKLFFANVSREIIVIGYNSITIVAIISLFMGAVLTLQTAYNMTNPLYPDYLIGLGTRDSIFLEFSSTIVGLILAGKVGSNIASEIGTMRVTQQIDALEIMGVNSANFLILPKIVAALCTFPFLCLISMIVGISGGWIAGELSGEVPTSQFVYGIQYLFIPYYILYSLIKISFFGVIITSISSYFGYFTNGGALEVGHSSTKAVVNSTLVILIFNLILTSILL